MIINAPVIAADSEEVTVSAKIELQSSSPDIPDQLWFKFPLRYKAYISDRSDGFLTAMLLLAMQYGEDIAVKGVVSPRLLSGIKEYQRVFNMWFPKMFNLIDISCDSLLISETPCGKGAVICAFSGGVDSFFSLYSHLRENESIDSSQITDALFALGFDIRLEDDTDFSIIKNAYAEMFERLGINFITARTNLQHFGTRPEWGVFHGTAIMGISQILGIQTSKLYVPSSLTYNNLIPWGTDPRIDHLLSTESLEVVHDGASFTRMEKTRVLSSWPETYDKLRVCFAKDGLNNCSQCEKCLRTMLTLDMLGTLTKYRTFTRPIDSSLVRKCRYHHQGEYDFAKELIKFAVNNKRWNIVLNVSYAVTISRILQIPKLATSGISLIKETFFT